MTSIADLFAGARSSREFSILTRCPSTTGNSRPSTIWSMPSRTDLRHRRGHALRTPGSQCRLRRQPTPAMLAALLLAQRALNTAPRFRVGDTDSYRIAAQVDAAIKATATGEGRPL